MARPLLDTLAWSDVVLIAKHLSGAATELQDLVLAMVKSRLGQNVWGGQAFDGGLWLAAHLGTVGTLGSSGSSGPLQSRTVGPVAASFAIPADWEDGLALTAYGREYLRLRRQAINFVGFVT